MGNCIGKEDKKDIPWSKTNFANQVFPKEEHGFLSSNSEERIKSLDVANINLVLKAGQADKTPSENKIDKVRQVLTKDDFLPSLLICLMGGDEDLEENVVVDNAVLEEKGKPDDDSDERDHKDRNDEDSGQEEPENDTDEEPSNSSPDEQIDSGKADTAVEETKLTAAIAATELMGDGETENTAEATSAIAVVAELKDDHDESFAPVDNHTINMEPHEEIGTQRPQTVEVARCPEKETVVLISFESVQNDGTKVFRVVRFVPTRQNTVVNTYDQDHVALHSADKEAAKSAANTLVNDPTTVQEDYEDGQDSSDSTSCSSAEIDSVDGMAACASDISRKLPVTGILRTGRGRRRADNVLPSRVFFDDDVEVIEVPFSSEEYADWSDEESESSSSVSEGLLDRMARRFREFNYARRQNRHRKQRIGKL